MIINAYSHSGRILNSRKTDGGGVESGAYEQESVVREGKAEGHTKTCNGRVQKEWGGRTHTRTHACTRGNGRQYRGTREW